MPRTPWWRRCTRISSARPAARRRRRPERARPGGVRAGGERPGGGARPDGRRGTRVARPRARVAGPVGGRPPARRGDDGEAVVAARPAGPRRAAGQRLREAVARRAPAVGQRAGLPRVRDGGHRQRQAQGQRHARAGGRPARARGAGVGDEGQRPDGRAALRAERDRAAGDAALRRRGAAGGLPRAVLRGHRAGRAEVGASRAPFKLLGRAPDNVGGWSRPPPGCLAARSVLPDALCMNFRSRLAIFSLLAFFAAAVPAAAQVTPVKTPIVGIADQKPDFLRDARFLSLHVNHARLAVSWDTLSDEGQTARMDAWLDAARENGVQPLVTFDRSVLPGQGRKLPTVVQYQTAFKKFHARYPWIRDYSTWNEANFCGQETCRHPELVARYYKALKRACPSCRVLGADILDLQSMGKWIKRFVKVAGQPKYWGFHNYVTANRFQTSRTKQLLKLVKGQIWLTETGGLVARRNKSLIKLPQGTAHAAKVTRFILRTLPALSPRISRVYLYHWDSSTAKDSWDSGFVGADVRARPSLGILKAVLARIPVGKR